MTTRFVFDYEITEGDYGKTLTATLKGADGLPLAGLGLNTAITLNMGREGQAPLLSKPAIADPDQTANKGVVSFTFADGDVDTAGEFLMTFVVEWPNAKLTFPTDPLRVRVRRALAAVS